ncbi:MAG TPA: PIG-L deacetylase family protein [Ktedonobacterales bacterium]|jgi:LmbE family N-acetylglucosaminyl deacetylase
MTMATLDAATVLAIAAHPDDIESWCAGAVAGLVYAGWRAVYILCTSGEKGTSDPNESARAVATRREGEQRQAARIVGADEPVFLRLGDGDLEDTREFRGLLVREIRRHRPRLLITHDPEHPWPPYITHRDHRIAGRIALDAAYPYACDPLHFPEQLIGDGLKPPDHHVDISATLNTKIAARLAHASQTSDAAALAESWRTRAQMTGQARGMRYAEAFKRLVLG